MSKFVTLVLEPLFEDEYGEYANLPLFNAHGDVVGYTGGEVPETGNPCEFYVMDEEGFPVCHSASENAKLVMKLNAEHIVRQNVERENAKLREQLADIPQCKECETMFKCAECEAMLDCGECLRADASQKERKRLDYENAKLRELVEDMAAEMRGLGVDFKRVCWCDYADRMRELGVEV